MSIYSILYENVKLKKMLDMDIGVLKFFTIIEFSTFLTREEFIFLICARIQLDVEVIFNFCPYVKHLTSK